MSTLSEAMSLLEKMTPAALRAEWRKHYRMPAPALSRDLLARGIAYRLQEKEQGGLSARLRA